MTDTTSTGVTVAVLGIDATLRVEQWSTGSGGGLLAPLQAAVGGLVDVVALAQDLTMYVHDNGIYECEPNPAATALAMAYGRLSTPIFGTVVLVGGVDDDGYDKSLTEGQVARTADAVALLRERQAVLDDLRLVQRGFAADF